MQRHQLLLVNAEHISTQWRDYIVEGSPEQHGGPASKLPWKLRDDNCVAVGTCVQSAGGIQQAGAKEDLHAAPFQPAQQGS